jgi:hypothetical protein
MVADRSAAIRVSKMWLKELIGSRSGADSPADPKTVSKLIDPGNSEDPALGDFRRL